MIVRNMGGAECCVAFDVATITMIPFPFLSTAFCPLDLINRPYSFLSRVLSRVSNGEGSALKELPMKTRRDPRRRIFHVRLRGEKTPETWTHVPQRAEP